MISMPEMERSELLDFARQAYATDEDPDIVRRSLAAYLRSPAAKKEHPSGLPLMLSYEDKRYSAIINGNGVLAIYRIRNDLQLKRMRRIPVPIIAAAWLAATNQIELKKKRGNKRSD